MRYFAERVESSSWILVGYNKLCLGIISLFTHKQQHPTSPKLYFIQNKTFQLTLMFGFKFLRNIKLPEQTSICICMHLHSLPFCFYGFSSFHTFKFHVGSILLKDFSSEISKLHSSLECINEVERKAFDRKNNIFSFGK